MQGLAKLLSDLLKLFQRSGDTPPTPPPLPPAPPTPEPPPDDLPAPTDEAPADETSGDEVPGMPLPGGGEVPLPVPESPPEETPPEELPLPGSAESGPADSGPAASEPPVSETPAEAPAEPPAETPIETMPEVPAGVPVDAAEADGSDPAAPPVVAPAPEVDAAPCRATIQPELGVVNIRSGPGLSFEKVGRASGGQAFGVGGVSGLDPDGFPWYWIDWDGGSGWIRGDLLVLSGDCDSLDAGRAAAAGAARRVHADLSGGALSAARAGRPHPGISQRP